MKQLSIWAANNKWLSRILIILSHGLLIIIAITISDILASIGKTFKGEWLYAIIIIAATILYPNKSFKSSYKNFYRRQKTLDFILVVFGFLLMISLASSLQQKDYSKIIIKTASGNMAVRYSVISDHEVNPTKAKKVSKRNLKKTFKSQLTKIRKAYKDTSTGGQILLIFLAVVVALGLAGLVAGLSCNLSCSGSEGLAGVVLVVGLGGIIFGLIKVIQSITGKKRKKKIETVTESKS